MHAYVEHDSGDSSQSEVSTKNWHIHLEARGMECGGGTEWIRGGEMAF